MLAWEKLHSMTSQKSTVSSSTHSKGRSMALPHTQKGKEDGPRLTVWLVTFMNGWCPGKSRGKGSVLSPPVSEVQIQHPQAPVTQTNMPSLLNTLQRVPQQQEAWVQHAGLHQRGEKA